MVLPLRTKSSTRHFVCAALWRRLSSRPRRNSNCRLECPLPGLVFVCQALCCRQPCLPSTREEPWLRFAGGAPPVFARSACQPAQPGRRQSEHARCSLSLSLSLNAGQLTSSSSCGTVLYSYTGPYNTMTRRSDTSPCAKMTSPAKYTLRWSRDASSRVSKSAMVLKNGNAEKNWSLIFSEICAAQRRLVQVHKT